MPYLAGPMSHCISLSDTLWNDLKSLVPIPLEDEARIALAVDLFLQERVSVGKAAEISGYSYQGFLALLKQRNIPAFRVDEESWKEDLETLEWLQKP